MHNNIGYEKGEVCNRDGCAGIVMEHDKERSCSCHISPPCSVCTTAREYCPVCGWDANEEYIDKERKELATYKGSDSEKSDIEFRKKMQDQHELFLKKMKGEIPFDKIEYQITDGTHSSMTKEGGFPIGTSKSEVLIHVNGSWGGRFEYFNEKAGKFKFIAYTD